MDVVPAGWYGWDYETEALYGPGQGRFVVLNDMARHGVTTGELIRIDEFGDIVEVEDVRPLEVMA